MLTTRTVRAALCVSAVDTRGPDVRCTEAPRPAAVVRSGTESETLFARADFEIM